MRENGLWSYISRFVISLDSISKSMITQKDFGEWICNDSSALAPLYLMKYVVTEAHAHANIYLQSH